MFFIKISSEFSIFISVLVPRIHLIVGREGLQGRSFFRLRLRLVCENIFFSLFSLASQSIEARQKVPVRGSFRHISLRILHAQQPMDSVTLFPHTKCKRRLKNYRSRKPSRPTIKRIRGISQSKDSNFDSLNYIGIKGKLKGLSFCGVGVCSASILILKK